MEKNYNRNFHNTESKKSLKPRPLTIKRIMAFSKAYEPKSPLDQLRFKN